jgi:predicted amidohydrolase
MRVVLIQSVIIWEDPQANRTYFETEINTISGAVDLIVLPEMFSTGFTMNPSAIAETMQGETVLWMQSLKAKTGNRKRSNQRK